MDRLNDFRSGFREWLVHCWERLAALDQDEAGSEHFIQSAVVASDLQGIRQECATLRRSARSHLLVGSLEREEHARIAALLHDLVWLLDVSPAAPPALVRQCIRIAQDRIGADLATEPVGWRARSCLELDCVDPA